MGPARAALAWAALGTAILLPIGVAATSPLLAWRDPVYILAGMAGVIAMALLLLQPLLAAGYLPGLRLPRGRRLHRWTGAALVGAVLLHVGGLWVTSPPDVIDALTFTSPTPFSAWGVIAMWALFAAALLGGLRRRLHLRPRVWRFAHTAMAALVVVCSVAHAMLVEGTMGTLSKAALCGLALAATAKVLRDLHSWALLTRRII
ncbi:MAG: ferric reductase-like transmembrane domain-containing protein [Rhodobacteraceae bacterium]|nr:ferric reductase-like transmembrane domain-containing protein [Paracoccaceae bacterium]MCB1402102.1 ferric reductase-like transmembrane domain-containing protein [Paracoccaceae bacterium]